VIRLGLRNPERERKKFSDPCDISNSNSEFRKVYSVCSFAVPGRREKFRESQLFLKYPIRGNDFVLNRLGFFSKLF